MDESLVETEAAKSRIAESGVKGMAVMTRQTDIDGDLQVLGQWSAADARIVQTAAMGAVDAEGSPDPVARGLQAIHEIGVGVELAATAAGHFMRGEVTPAPVRGDGCGGQNTQHARSVRAVSPTPETFVPPPIGSGTEEV